jgi:DNA-binding CsgD family transcriptional regulator
MLMNYKNIITDLPIGCDRDQTDIIDRSVFLFPYEALYIYSLVTKRMIYAKGWEELLGYKDEDISLLKLIGITVPAYLPFCVEMNNKALEFILTKKEYLEEYSCIVYSKKFHRNGEELPLIESVGVFKSENGVATEIIGRYQLNRQAKKGKIIQYYAYGPEKAAFEESLRKDLFKYPAISKKEHEALTMLAQGKSYKQVADHFKISLSAAKKRIVPLFERFGVNNLAHLIHFAYQNGLIDTP